MSSQNLPQNTSVGLGEALITLNQIWHILRARLRLILVPIILFPILGVALTLQMDKIYSATASIFIDFTVDDPVRNRSFSADLALAYINTQIDIIHSPLIRNEVIERMKEEDYSELFQHILFDDDGLAVPLEKLRENLRKKMKVSSNTQSRIVHLSIDDTVPRAAQALANLYAETYIESSTEIKSSHANEQVSSYNNSLQQMRQDLTDAQQSISDYQRLVGIVNIDEHLSYQTQRLNDLSKELVNIDIQLKNTSARFQQIRRIENNPKRLNAFPDISRNNYIQGLKQQIAALESKMAEQKILIGAEHTEARRMRAELASYRRSYKTAVQEIIDGLESEIFILRESRGTVASTIRSQEDEILALKQHHDHIDTLVREKESRERIYQAAINRYDTILLAAEAIKPDASIISEAAVPHRKSRPSGMKNLILSIFAGVSVGLGLALLLELRQRRIRCREDLEQSLSLPMLGEVTK